mmetsp:Transcript_40865/g.79576  ORF Transcript_40865/g.79576 Transcript_40865/m.79576 type:complete len:225 (-) Transcript_40865:420-1094(-)
MNPGALSLSRSLYLPPSSSSSSSSLSSHERSALTMESKSIISLSSSISQSSILASSGFVVALLLLSSFSVAPSRLKSGHTSTSPPEISETARDAFFFFFFGLGFFFFLSLPDDFGGEVLDAAAADDDVDADAGTPPVAEEDETDFIGDIFGFFGRTIDEPTPPGTCGGCRESMTGVAPPSSSSSTACLRPSGRPKPSHCDSDFTITRRSSLVRIPAFRSILAYR